MAQRPLPRYPWRRCAARPAQTGRGMQTLVMSDAGWLPYTARPPLAPLRRSGPGAMSWAVVCTGRCLSYRGRTRGRDGARRGWGRERPHAPPLVRIFCCQQAAALTRAGLTRTTSARRRLLAGCALMTLCVHCTSALCVALPRCEHRHQIRARPVWHLGIVAGLCTRPSDGPAVFVCVCVCMLARTRVHSSFAVDAGVSMCLVLQTVPAGGSAEGFLAGLPAPLRVPHSRAAACWAPRVRMWRGGPQRSAVGGQPAHAPVPCGARPLQQPAWQACCMAKRQSMGQQDSSQRGLLFLAANCSLRLGVRACPTRQIV